MAIRPFAMLIFPAFLLIGQENGYRESVRTARDLMEAKNYTKAIPYLQDAVDNRGKDLAALEMLGTAYLYSSSEVDQHQNLERAEKAMQQAIDAGGKAVFRAGLGHDRVKGKNMVDTIDGLLSISKPSLEFSGSSGGDAIKVALGDIRSCGQSTGYGKEYAAYHLKLAKTDYYFRPYHFRHDEGDLVCTLIAKNSKK
jgi:hypothetical protein